MRSCVNQSTLFLTEDKHIGRAMKGRKEKL
jgi:hypothetical protein